MQTQFLMTFAWLDSSMTLVELTRMQQQPGETVDQFLERFQMAHLRCKMSIYEEELVAISQDALDIWIRKKIEGEHFWDLYELPKRTTRYEALLREESRTTTTYHLDTFPLEVDVTEFVKGDTVICEPLVKKNTKANEKQRIREERKYSFDLEK